MITKNNRVSPFVSGMGGASVLLMSTLLIGCSQPQAPAAGQTPSAAPATAATAAAAAPAAVAVDPTMPVELSPAERHAATTPAKSCNIEGVAGNKFSAGPVEVKTGSPAVVINGWFVDTDLHNVPATGYLQFQNTDKAHVWRLPIKTGQKRLDVAKNLGGDAAYDGSGYSATVNLGALPAGDYHTVIAFGDAGAMKVCDNGRMISVKQ